MYDVLVVVNLNECLNCGELKCFYYVCVFCGYYDDCEVVVMVDEIDLDDEVV